MAITKELPCVNVLIAVLLILIAGLTFLATAVLVVGVEFADELVPMLEVTEEATELVNEEVTMLDVSELAGMEVTADDVELTGTLGVETRCS